jgi:hypothetical protein
LKRSGGPKPAASFKQRERSFSADVFSISQTMRLTRRQIVTAAGCLAGAALPAEALLLRKDQFKSTITTLFWVGESSDVDNAFIPNDVSYWDKDWQMNYGGVDDPAHRNGFWPADFTPKENPFYVALPYGEFKSGHGYDLRPDAQNIPWYRRHLTPLLKNHWVAVKLADRMCYAQWEDVGPFEVDDFDYVFGAAPTPRNTFDLKAGLDVSPAVWHYLGMQDNQVTAWHFVDVVDVPAGPWTEIVTTSGNNRLI